MPVPPMPQVAGGDAAAALLVGRAEADRIALGEPILLLLFGGRTEAGLDALHRSLRARMEKGDDHAVAGKDDEAATDEKVEGMHRLHAASRAQRRGLKTSERHPHKETLG
jgi:hypothetical protein